MPRSGPGGHIGSSPGNNCVCRVSLEGVVSPPPPAQPPSLITTQAPPLSAARHATCTWQGNERSWTEWAPGNIHLVEWCQPIPKSTSRWLGKPSGAAGSPRGAQKTNVYSGVITSSINATRRTLGLNQAHGHNLAARRRKRPVCVAGFMLHPEKGGGIPDRSLHSRARRRYEHIATLNICATPAGRSPRERRSPYSTA